MDIGNNRNAMCPAVGPKVAEIAAIEADNSRVEAVRIEVVVQDIVDNPPVTVYDVT